MSNNAVGALYKRIIDQVMESSKNDFEENGVDARMIATLQDTWQANLSKRHTAHFPWEPQPPPSETSNTTASGPSRTSQTKASNATSRPAPQQQATTQVKQEPGTSNSQPFPPPNPYTNNPNAAQERAYSLVQERMHSQPVNPSTNPVNGLGNIQLPSQIQPQRPQGAYMPQYANQQQYAQHQPPRPQQLQMPPQQIPRKRSASPTTPRIKQERDDSNSLLRAQGDGAGDAGVSSPAEQWSAVMAHRASVDQGGANGRRAADGMIRAHVAQNMQRLEGGGLLVPLEERYRRGHPQRLAYEGKGKGNVAVTKLGMPDVPLAAKPSGTMPAQLDGGAETDIKPDLDDDDDAKDVDAINSDLDDSEDEVGDGMIGDDYEGNQIICLYDKVQRVKNKWKCTLKDGVVDVDGKDYVFHKATGEFEW